LVYFLVKWIIGAPTWGLTKENAMRVARLFGNLIWFIPGLIMAIGWFIGGLFCCITIIGIPFGIAEFRIAGLCLWPFGYEVQNATQKAGCISTGFNIIWLLPGCFIALGHLIWALLLTLPVITIPFAKQHMKLAALSLAPFGKRVVKINPT
jgi:uncharacterized membrane protein YccF (DUF307 family)